MLPPLRDRKDDIPAISEAILVNLNKKHGCRVTGLHPSTLERFQAHAWPGNIRELRNILERAVIMASEGLILPKHVAMDSNANIEPHPSGTPIHDQSAANERNQGSEQSSGNEQSPANDQSEHMEALRIRPGASMEEIEETYINLILQRTNNNKTRAAEILGISVRTLHNRLGQLGKMAGDKLRATGATG
jgi:DNA-binding NtrC family response regulator